MIIDMHVHARFLPQLAPEGPGKRPLGGDLIAMMDARGIDMAAVLCTASPEQRRCFDTTEEVFSVCRGAPDRLIPFCGLDPRMVKNAADADFGPLLEGYKDVGIRGVGEYIPNLPFDDPLNMNLFRQVEEAGLPLTFHIGPALGGCYGCYDELGLPRLEKVLKACPALKLIGHSQPFWSEISADVTGNTRGGYPAGPVQPGRVVELLRSYPNLYADLSARSGYNAITRDRDFGCRFMEEFQDRLLFATDIAHVVQETPIVELFDELRREKRISPAAYEKITWKNAAELLGLQP